MSSAHSAERPSDPAASAAAMEQRVAVVVNGNAKNATAEVISTLDQILNGGDLFVSRKLSDARHIARTLVARGYGTVLTGGGDGTFTVMVTEVVHEARRSGRPLPRFGLLKLGTGNSLAWVVGSQGADKRDLQADISRLIEDAGSRSMRLIEVEGFIAPFCGLGADAVVLADYAKTRGMLSKTPLARVAPGPLAYILATTTRTIPSYFLRKMPHCRVRNDGAEAYRLGAKGSIVGPPIPTGQTIYEGPMGICALSTIPYYGYGFRMFPYAEERPDRMNLRIATIRPISFVRHFPEIWRGEYDNPEELSDYLVDAVTIEVDPPTGFQIAGDPQGERATISALLSPTPIRLVDFYAPPNAE
jgi:diacylglycerol kinase family enzyme